MGDDQRDSAERDLTYAQDKKRAELDEVWEFYKKKTQYKYDQYKTADHGYGDYADEYGSDYTHYDIHQELVLSILEAVDYYGEEADIKLILTQAGEGGIDIYGGQDVKALYREDREGTLEYQRYSSGYTRPTYGY